MEYNWADPKKNSLVTAKLMKKLEDSRMKRLAETRSVVTMQLHPSNRQKLNSQRKLVYTTRGVKHFRKSKMPNANCLPELDTKLSPENNGSSCLEGEHQDKNLEHDKNILYTHSTIDNILYASSKIAATMDNNLKICKIETQVTENLKHKDCANVNDGSLPPIKKNMHSYFYKKNRKQRQLEASLKTYSHDTASSIGSDSLKNLRHLKLYQPYLNTLLNSQNEFNNQENPPPIQDYLDPGFLPRRQTCPTSIEQIGFHNYEPGTDNLVTSKSARLHNEDCSLGTGKFRNQVQKTSRQQKYNSQCIVETGTPTCIVPLSESESGNLEITTVNQEKTNTKSAAVWKKKTQKLEGGMSLSELKKEHAAALQLLSELHDSQFSSSFKSDYISPEYINSSKSTVGKSQSNALENRMYNQLNNCEILVIDPCERLLVSKLRSMIPLQYVHKAEVNLALNSDKTSRKKAELKKNACDNSNTIEYKDASQVLSTSVNQTLIDDTYEDERFDPDE